MAQTQYDDEEERKQRKARRAARRRRERRRALIMRTMIFVLLLLVLVAVIVMMNRIEKRPSRTDSIPGNTASESTAGTAESTGTAAGSETEAQTENTPAVTENTAPAAQVIANPQTREEVLETAEALATQYDYDAAIAVIQSFPDYISDQELNDKIGQITAQKSSCVAVDVSTTPHVFFHSLINDSRGLIASATCTEERVEKNNKAMATVAEFNAMMEKMYQAGYVLISLDDLVVKTENADGSVTLTKNTQLLLPPGKKPLIMSEDDLSYYHSYGENGAQGYADRLVVTETGEVKAQYTDPSGNVLIGDYDMPPLIETFIKNHPDFCYQGARPTIALTGYNGVFGYRTNDYYKEGPDGADLNEAQKQFLRTHPEYNFDHDVAEATKVANALKATGWTFASHTYGHRNATDSSVDALIRDHERWKIAVETCVGKTDKIIFAFGGDIGPVWGYTAENEKYQYFLGQGFHIFCNVDGNIGWTEFGNEYVRTGRVALDGVTMYNAMDPNTDSHNTYARDFEILGITDIASFFDPNRNTAYCLSES